MGRFSDWPFVADGESRHETAVLLIGTAQEHDIDPSLVKAVPGGFRIPETLADVLYSESDKPKKGASKKASGNRAAKNDNSKEE